METDWINCPKCGRQNSPSHNFCQYCATPLKQDAPVAPPKVTYREAGSPLDLLRDKITPAEGESSVRTYHCTYYKSRLLGLKASGYLAVTNKRVIFQALGTSSAGLSVIQSEVPVADVSGISSYKGTYFSFGALISAFILSVLCFLVMPLITTYLFARTSNYSNMLVFGWIVGIAALLLSFFISNKSIWKPACISVGTSALAFVGGISFLAGSYLGLFGGGSGNQGQGLAMIVAFLSAIYLLFSIVWYSRRPTFSLSVNSKGGSSTPINISGATGIGIFDVAAGKALTAEPAADAEPMLKELGAVVMDIQTLGDFGISKWSIR